MGKGTTGFSHKNNEHLYQLGAILGVDSSPFQEEDTGSQGHFDTEGFTEAVENAAANNYDFRRSLEAANLAGEKGLPKGIGSIEDAYAVHKWMKDQHGGGGKYSSRRCWWYIQ